MLLWPVCTDIANTSCLFVFEDLSKPVECNSIGAYLHILGSIGKVTKFVGHGVMSKGSITALTEPFSIL